VSDHQSPGGLEKAAVTHAQWQHTLSIENTVPRWYDACLLRPLDFLARLAALVPKPRVNLTRFHGVSPNSRHLALVTKAARGRGNKTNVSDELPTPAERHASMTWAQRLMRVFNETKKIFIAY